MRNLIFVNMMRLRKSRIFFGGVIVSMAYIAFHLFMNYQDIKALPEIVVKYDPNWYFLFDSNVSPLSIASAFCSVFCSIFVGTEYSDGTMRNKLMVGHTRKNIYCANLLTVFLATAFVYLAGFLIAIIVGIPMFGWNLAYPMQFVFRIFSGILMLAAYAGIFTLLSMLIDSKAVAVTVCIVFYVLLFEVGPSLQIHYMDIESVRPLQEFLYDFLPSGQEFQISSGNIQRPYRLPVYSMICIALTTVCGMTVFEKKDLK